LNDSFPPVIDGVANVVMNYARYLQSDHDCSVVVGTPRYPNADYSSYSYPVIPYQSFDTAAVASGYRTGNPFAEKEVSQLAAFQPDIIHTHCPASATVIARILREKVDAPVIFTYHTKYDIDIRRTVPFRPVADEGIRMMVHNIEACDDIWVVSRGAGESLKALGFEGDYRVMNNGVDFARGRVDEKEVAAVTSDYDLPAGVPMFLFVGRLMTYKGLPLILDALGMLHDAGQDFRMVFVGKGPDQQLLEEKAAALGIGDKCILIGPIYDRNILRAWNTRADLFLFPSTFDTNGLVVREAAACGLASVLIRDSCAAEGVTDGRNGFLIDETAEAMAALLKEMCGDLAHLHQVGEKAMDEIYLSWEDCVSAAYDRYAAVLEEKKAGSLPKKKKMATDYLVSLTAQRMTDLEQFRRVKNELFNGFRETAEGMMENIQDASESAEHLFDRSEDFIKDFYHLFKH
jgi:glycosyltransferase involved in cell wall biosynthesis